MKYKVGDAVIAIAYLANPRDGKLSSREMIPTKYLDLIDSKEVLIIKECHIDSNGIEYYIVAGKSLHTFFNDELRIAEVTNWKSFLED